MEECINSIPLIGTMLDLYIITMGELTYKFQILLLTFGITSKVKIRAEKTLNNELNARFLLFVKHHQHYNYSINKIINIYACVNIYREVFSFIYYLILCPYNSLPMFCLLEVV